jgi:glutamate dehydrogenase (NAD(P)+)
MGGSLGRAEATGYGVVFTLREALRERNVRIENTRASVQGFGNVAQHAIRLYQQMGGRVVCVSSWDQKEQGAVSFRKEAGVDLEALLGITDRFGGIDREQARRLGYEVLPGDAWIEQKVDVLLPCALENQITDETVRRVNAGVRFVAEGANGPTTLEGDSALAQKGVVVIPDFLANAGGVTCSYFEQVQSNANYFWEKEEVLGKLDVKMTAAYRAVSEMAQRKKTGLRDAAYLIAVGRVAQACRDRGWV